MLNVKPNSIPFKMSLKSVKKTFKPKKRMLKKWRKPKSNLNSKTKKSSKSTKFKPKTLRSNLMIQKINAGNTENKSPP